MPGTSEALPAWGNAAIAGFAVLLAAGCASGDGRPGRTPPSGEIDELHLIVTSVAVNLDDRPGPDGFGARVYASSRKSAAPPITGGTLDILLFDGVVAVDELAARQPLRRWSYTAGELKGFLQKTAVGASYVFMPAWGEARPLKEQITVAVRHVSAEGRKVYSAPGTIALPVK